MTTDIDHVVDDYAREVIAGRRKHWWEDNSKFRKSFFDHRGSVQNQGPSDQKDDVSFHLPEQPVVVELRYL